MIIEGPLGSPIFVERLATLKEWNRRMLAELDRDPANRLGVIRSKYYPDDLAASFRTSRPKS